MTHHVLHWKAPADLRLHPLQRSLPAPDKESAEWLSFVEALQAATVESCPPLFITEDGRIMDGGRRWRAAKQLGWETLPCIIRPEHEAATLIVDSLFGQRNLTRGAKVYLALALLPEWTESAEMRRLENLRRGAKTIEKSWNRPKCSNCTSGELSPLLERWGVSLRTFRQAEHVRKLLDQDAALREHWEPLLLSGERNLWNVDSGVKGAATDQTKTEAARERSQLELFADGWETFTRASKQWTRFSPENRARVTEFVRRHIAELPEELCREMQRAIEERIGAAA